MRVLLVGGGSGGHINPQLAVAHELKQIDPKLEIHYAIEKGGKFLRLPKSDKNIDTVHTVFAGKFRRYHGESFAQHLQDLPTILKNIRDFFVFILGIFQCLVLVRRINPAVVFMKGGFVGVPVGLACAFWRIPFFTHDSDTVPGLANRLIGRWARVHAVGMPAEFYSYPKQKTRFVGIPVASDYKKVTPEIRSDYRKKLHLPTDSIVICITGGSQGAVKLNSAFLAVAAQLVKRYSKLQVLHQTGNANEELYRSVNDDVSSRVLEFGHVNDLFHYTGAADLVITRAGATTIAELAIQQQPCLVVPSPVLTGGQQTKNTEHMLSLGAVEAISEQEADNPEIFAQKITQILDSSSLRSTLSKNIARLAKPNAASEIAKLIFELGTTKIQ